METGHQSLIPPRIGLGLVLMLFIFFAPDLKDFLDRFLFSLNRLAIVLVPFVCF